MLNTDVALVQPAGEPRYVERGGQLPTEGGDADSLHEVLRNLEGLTMGVPPLPMREIPAHMQRHTVGVPEQFLVPLWRIARVVLAFQ